MPPLITRIQAGCQDLMFNQRQACQQSAQQSMDFLFWGIIILAFICVVALALKAKKDGEL